MEGILRNNKFARDMLLIASIGCVLAGLYGAERAEKEAEEVAKMAASENAIIYEVPE